MDHEAIVNRAGTGRQTRRAYMLLRAMILEGTLQAGAVLNETRLAAELGISKTPVRSALGTLRQEGLVEGGPRRQVIIPDFSPSDRDELLRVREALELIVVQRACTTMSGEELDHIWNIVRRQKRAAEAGEESDFIRLDEEMHVSLATLAGLHVVPRMMLQLRGFVSLMHLNTRRDSAYMTRVVEEHERILDAVERRDVPAAIQALLSHLHTSEYVSAGNTTELFGEPPLPTSPSPRSAFERSVEAAKKQRREQARPTQRR